MVAYHSDNRAVSKRVVFAQTVEAPRVVYDRSFVSNTTNNSIEEGSFYLEWKQSENVTDFVFSTNFSNTTSLENQLWSAVVLNTESAMVFILFYSKTCSR